MFYINPNPVIPALPKLDDKRLIDIVKSKKPEEILKNLTDEGWIRIRRYPNAYWSIQFGRMNPRVKKQVNRFAFSARKGINGTKESDPYMDVILVGFYDNYRKRIDI